MCDFFCNFARKIGLHIQITQALNLIINWATIDSVQRQLMQNKEIGLI